VISPVTLRKFLRKEGGDFLKGFLQIVGEPIGIVDYGGDLLAGTAFSDGPGSPGASDNRVPILYEGVAGWVIGREGSKLPGMVALLIQHLLRQEAEKRTLASEVLDKYRELHLLYRLSERLITSPQPEVIGQVALNEVCAGVQTPNGLIVLTHARDEKPETIATCGCSCELNPEAFDPEQLIGRVISTGVAEIANHVPAEKYLNGAKTETVSLMCAPLKAENQVVGVFILLSDDQRVFSAGDLKLLNAIAMQTAPAIEIAHLHQVELANAWLERDLQMARRVQSGLLPGQMPVLPGWDVAAFWRPARVVSGDLYDFISFPDGKLGLVVADVTDKGVPAALLMANARSVLRGAAASAGRSGWDAPGRLLAQVNDVLTEEMPMDMFVTCLLAVLDPKSGHVRFANAGHNPPYLRTTQGVIEPRATGIPLGLFPDLEYEEKEVFLENGDTLLMYSDGLTEAHNPQKEMFGFPRLRQLLADLPADLQVESNVLIEQLIAQLEAFTGPGWEQEDDITMITLTRAC
jgi:serine phosphatase RsbU (regulator of sigma subunit)